MFAKLFDTPHGQLLVTKEYEDDDTDAPYGLNSRGEPYRDVNPATVFSFESEDQRDGAFDETTQERADTIAEEIARVVRAFTDGGGE